MRTLSEILGFVVFAMYGASSAAYLRHFFQPDAAVGAYKRTLFRATLALHAAYLAVGWAAAGHMPLYNRFAILAVVVFAYSLIYLVVETRTGQAEVGGFILALATIFFGVSLFSFGQPVELDARFQGPMFAFHISTVILAYSALFLGFLFAGLYLLLYYEIKEHRLGRIYQRLPPLELLATMSNHANILGFGFLTVGIVAGSLWAKQVWDLYFGLDPKLIATAAVWLIYGAGVLAARLPGWSRKRSAYVSVLGFFTLVFSFVLLHSVVVSQHNF